MLALEKQIENSQEIDKYKDQQIIQAERAIDDILNKLRANNHTSKAENFVKEAKEVEVQNILNKLNIPNHTSKAATFVQEAQKLKEKQDNKAKDLKESNPFEVKIKIKKLAHKYQAIWHKDINFTIIPNGITEEKMLYTINRMIQTGETLLVSYNNLYRPWAIPR